MIPPKSSRFTKPSRRTQPSVDELDLDDDTVYDAGVVAEQIELGYDLQADAAVKPMTDNPASSRPGEVDSW